MSNQLKMNRKCYMPALLEDCSCIKLASPSKWEICGHSRAGERTGIWLKPLRIVLDAGMVTYWTPKAIFLTHSHCDHTLALPCIVSYRDKPIQNKSFTREGDLCGKAVENPLCGTPVYMPSNCIPKIQKLMEAVIDLSDNNDTFVYDGDQELIWRRQGYHPFVASPGDIFNIPGIANIEV